MDIRNIITFVHVAEMGSFTKAANFLGYSQSTVSFQIKQLEKEFGCQLFERINHSVALTGKGRELLEYAHRINKLTDEMHEAMTQDHQIAGSVRIATADSLGASLMREKFVTFRQQYPGIMLKLIPAGTEEMFRMMDCNEVDAIMTLDSHIYNTEYMLVKEEKAEAVFVAAPKLVEEILAEWQHGFAGRLGRAGGRHRCTPRLYRAGADGAREPGSIAGGGHGVGDLETDDLPPPQVDVQAAGLCDPTYFCD